MKVRIEHRETVTSVYEIDAPSLEDALENFLAFEPVSRTPEFGSGRVTHHEVLDRRTIPADVKAPEQGDMW